jgi:hypothetical protein
MPVSAAASRKLQATSCLELEACSLKLGVVS